MSDHAESRWLLVWKQLPLVVGLLVLWLLLWEEITVISVVTGVVLAVLVTRLLYLPPVLLSGRFNPWRGLLFGLRMMWDVTVASLQVAWRSVDLRWQPVNSIIAVPLRTHSDLVLTLTAESVSVVPGTVVVDVDRGRSVLYLHAFGTRTHEDAEGARRAVLGIEERILLAMGTREEAAAVRTVRRQRRERKKEARK